MVLDSLQSGHLQSADHQLARCKKDLVSAKLDLLDATLNTAKVKMETRKAAEQLVWKNYETRLELAKANLILLSTDLEALEINNPTDSEELVSKIAVALEDAEELEKLDNID